MQQPVRRIEKGVGPRMGPNKIEVGGFRAERQRGRFHFTQGGISFEHPTRGALGDSRDVARAADRQGFEKSCHPIRERPFGRPFETRKAPVRLRNPRVLIIDHIRYSEPGADQSSQNHGHIRRYRDEQQIDGPRAVHPADGAPVMPQTAHSDVPDPQPPHPSHGQSAGTYDFQPGRKQAFVIRIYRALVMLRGCGDHDGVPAELFKMRCEQTRPDRRRHAARRKIRRDNRHGAGSPRHGWPPSVSARGYSRRLRTRCRNTSRKRFIWNSRLPSRSA